MHTAWEYRFVPFGVRHPRHRPRVHPVITGSVLAAPGQDARHLPHWIVISCLLSLDRGWVLATHP